MMTGLRLSWHAGIIVSTENRCGRTIISKDEFHYDVVRAKVWWSVVLEQLGIFRSLMLVSDGQSTVKATRIGPLNRYRYDCALRKTNNCSNDFRFLFSFSIAK